MIIFAQKIIKAERACFTKPLNLNIATSGTTVAKLINNITLKNTKFPFQTYFALIILD